MNTNLQRADIVSKLLDLVLKKTCISCLQGCSERSAVSGVLKTLQSNLMKSPCWCFAGIAQ